MKNYVIWADKTGKMLWSRAFQFRDQAEEFAEKKNAENNVPCIIISSDSIINLNTHFAG